MSKPDRSDFFVISDNANSHYALKHWLKEREFNELEIGKPDKHGNPILKLIMRTDDSKFAKKGLICCLMDSKETALLLINQHLEETNNVHHNN